MSSKTFPTFLPNKGIQIDAPEEFLLDQLSPYSRNMEYKNELIQSRGGLSKFSQIALSGRIMTQFRFKKANQDVFNMFFTPKDIYAYDFTNSRFDILTPVYTTGTVKVVNGSAVVHGGLSVDTCDTNPVDWADGSGGNVTVSRETSDKQDGTASVKLAVAAGAAVGLLAYHNIASVNLTAYDSIGFWIKSSVNTNNGDLQFLLDNTAACASPLETINIPALVANTWTWVNLAFVTPANLTAVISIGIKQAVDIGACNIFVDQIVVGDWVDNIAVGDYFKIGSTGIHTGATWYEVLTVDSDTQITLTAVYAGSSADQQTYAIRLIFNGGPTDDWSCVKFTDENLGDIVVAVNGVDGPIYWTGSGQVAFITGLATGFTSARYVNAYKDRIIYSWTIEGGSNQTERKRWSGVADITANNDLDFIDIIDEGGEIKGAINQGDYHITVKADNFYTGRYIGGDEIFGFERAQSPVGCKSGRSLVIDKEWLYYYGKDNKFHRWNLVTDQVISEGVFDESKNFDPELDVQINGANFVHRNQIRWFCPLNANGYNNHVFVFDYKNESMQIWTCSAEQALHSIGYYLLQDDLYLDDAIWGDYYLDEQTGYWDDVSVLSSAPVFIYGGYDGYVRICDTGTTDDSLSYTSILRIKRLNFNAPQNRKRLWKQQYWFEQSAVGSVSLSIYKDDSVSSTAITTFDLNDETRDIVKLTATVDLHAEDFQPELQSTGFFALLGFLSEVFPKRRSF